MATLILANGVTTEIRPKNGSFFTRSEKQEYVPGNNCIVFLDDEMSMMCCWPSGRDDGMECNRAATDMMRKMTGDRKAKPLYGPVLLFSNLEFSADGRDGVDASGCRKVDIYTDGSCIRNPGGNGGTGWCVVIDGEISARGGVGYISTTNNRMEMRAAIEAFEAFGHRLEPSDRITLYSDSKLVIETMRGRFRSKKNLDLWGTLHEINERYKITWEWIPGHRGNKYNELCDTLAAEAYAGGGMLVHDIGYVRKQEQDPFPRNKNLKRRHR